MLISLIVAVIVAGLIYLLFQALPLPEPFKSILMVLVILAIIVWFLQGGTVDTLRL